MLPFAQETEDGRLKLYFPTGEQDAGVTVYQGQLGVVVTMAPDDWRRVLAGRVPGVKRPGLPKPSKN